MSNDASSIPSSDPFAAVNDLFTSMHTALGGPSAASVDGDDFLASMESAFNRVRAESGFTFEPSPHAAGTDSASSPSSCEPTASASAVLDTSINAPILIELSGQGDLELYLILDTAIARWVDAGGQIPTGACEEGLDMDEAFGSNPNWNDRALCLDLTEPFGKTFTGAVDLARYVAANNISITDTWPGHIY